MNEKKIKELRRKGRQVRNELFKQFADDLKKLPFSARLKIALKIIKGKKWKNKINVSKS